MQAEKTDIDYASITERQQTVWAAGDFHEIARQTMSMSEALVAAVDPRAGQRVLDVACGSGNAALVAARRYCEVTGIDYVPELIEHARIRAEAEAVSIDFRVGDAQVLPFPDGSFDVVLSAIGVMFAPDQEQAASELLRVCRPGGKIALASWMPEQFGGDFFGAHARHVPPPPGVKPPVRWGTETGLEELLGGGTEQIRNRRYTTYAYYHSIEHIMELFRRYFGPTVLAFEKVNPADRQSLHDDIAAVFRRYNRAEDGTAVIAYEHLQTVAIRSAE
ncbi:MAG: class I SAM-dependent methyltransferase [Aquisalimonadaceae bacterium]